MLKMHSKFIQTMMIDVLIVITFLIVFSGGLLLYMMYMPSQSFQGEESPFNQTEISLAENLKSHVVRLASDPQGRNNHTHLGLTPARDYIVDQLKTYGYTISLQTYQAQTQSPMPSEFAFKKDDYTTFINIEAELPGRTNDILIIGAHYDSVSNCPGANDNASGVAALLEMARLFKNQTLHKTVRWVVFANEEPPFFQTVAMGSLVYANRSAERKENIVGMLALETIGYFTEVPESQHYPPPLHYFYPDRGNFIAFVGNLSSRTLVRKSIGTFRKKALIPSEGIAAPAFIPGVSWSDHWAFWKNDYPAIMVTDTAPYRYPYYHTAEDTPDKIHYEKMARVVMGLQAVVEALAE